jgi:hypothetical protein
MHLLSQHSCNSIFTLGCSITLVWELILQLWISSRYTQLSTYTLFVDFLHNVMHNTSTTIINSASSISMSSTMIKINVVHSNTPFYVSPTSLKCRSQLYHTTTHYYKPSDNQYYISNYNLHSYVIRYDSENCNWYTMPSKLNTANN